MKSVHGVAGLMIAAVVLSGCQTTQYEYRKVADGPDLGTAGAYCEMQSYGVPQSTSVFFGNAMYVNSMALQQTMANQARVNNFFQACMRYAGWQLFEVPATAGPGLPSPPPPPAGR